MPAGPRATPPHVLAGLPELDVHPDVPAGLRLHEGGVRLVTLTNGSAEMPAGAFARAGVLDLFRAAAVRQHPCPVEAG